MFWNFIIGIISFGLNLILAPKPQDAKPSSVDELEAPVAEEGLEIPDVFGTANLRGPNVTWYGNFSSHAIKGPRRYGLFGPRQTVGHTYRISMQMVLCMGPVDELKEVWVGDQLAFDEGSTGGEFRIDASFEGQGGDNDVAGPVDFEIGSHTQLQNAHLQVEMDEVNIPAFRGVSTLVLKNVQIGNSTYMAPWETKIQRIHLRPDGSEQWYDAKAAIPRTGDGFFEKIELEGNHYSNTAKFVDMTDDLIVRISSSGTEIEIIEALTGEEIITKPISYTPIGVMVSSITGEFFVWTSLGDFYVYDLFTGDEKQFVNVAAPFGGTTYGRYVGWGHVREVNGIIYMMFASFLNIACYAKVADLWTFQFNEWRGYYFGGFSGQITFSDEFVYWNHGDGHIAVFPWTPSGIGSVYYAPKWTYDPPLGLLGGQVFPVYSVLVYREDLEQMLLIVHGSDTGHIYLLSKDMLTQEGYLETEHNISGPNIHADYRTSNALVDSNRIIFYSSQLSDKSIYIYSISPLALVAKYEPEQWGMTNDTFPSSSIGIPARSYILVSKGTGGDTVFFFGADFDMNPAHIIRECITHRMGYLDADIDDDIFTDAADTLYAEGFGLTFTWAREEEVGEFISIVLSHIDAYLYVSRTTGKFILKLVRDDYDIDTIPQLDEDDVIEWIEVNRRTLADAVNSVTVKFTNREHEGEDSERGKPGSHQVDNIAQMQQMANGGIPDRVMITRHYPGISTGTLATRVGERDVKSLGIGVISGRIRCKRTVESLNPGDPFRLTSALHELEGEVMRVADIQLGDGRSNSITISFIQDVFALGEEGLVDTSTSDWENPSSPPQPMDYRLVWEAPYRQFVEYVGIAQVDSLFSADTSSGIIEAAGLRSTSDMTDLMISTNLNSGAFEDGELFSASPGGILSSDIDEIETSIVLTEEQDLDSVEVGSLAAINSDDRDLMEIVRIDAVDTDTSTITVSRGMSDTTPKSHLASSVFVVYEGFSDTDGDTYVDDDIIGVKIITFTTRGQLDSAFAPVDFVTMDSRAIRPFRPANCTLNGQGYGTLDAELIDPIPAAWVNRNRLTDLTTPLDWTDPTEAMEAGQTVELRLLDIDGTEVFVYTGLTGTTQDIDPADFGDRATADVEFDSERDGFTAWQAHKIRVLLPANLLLSGDQQSGTDFLLLSGDQQSGADVLRLSGTLS